MEQKNILKHSLTEYMKRLWECGLTTVLGGNISCRVDGGMLITPSSINKNELKDSDIIEMDFDSNIIDGLHEPSMEHRIHSSIYKSRLDIGAIIHSHSFYSTLFSIIDKEINVIITAESAKNIGVVGVVDYATMGTQRLSDSISQKINNHNVILMKNHGVVTVGKNLLEAFYRLEIVEQTAKLTYHSFGFSICNISNEDIEMYLNKK